MARNPGLYADLGKKSSDVLSKDFPDKNKFEFKSNRIGNGLTFESSLTQEKDGGVYGFIFPKYKLNAYGVTAGVRFDTKRNAKLEVTHEGAVKGLKATVTAHGDNESVTVDSEYKHEKFTLQGLVNVLSAKGNTVTGSAVFTHQGFALGLQTEYQIDKWNTVNGHFSYSFADTTLGLTARANTNSSTNILGFNYFQRFYDRTIVAAEASADISKTTEIPKITIGGSHELDSVNTLKAKADTDGRVSVAFSHKLSPAARVTFGSSFNTNNFSSGGHNTFGVQFNFSD